MIWVNQPGMISGRRAGRRWCMMPASMVESDRGLRNKVLFRLSFDAGQTLA